MMITDVHSALHQLPDKSLSESLVPLALFLTGFLNLLTLRETRVLSLRTSRQIFSLSEYSSTSCCDLSSEEQLLLSTPLPLLFSSSTSSSLIACGLLVLRLLLLECFKPLTFTTRCCNSWCSFSNLLLRSLLACPGDIVPGDTLQATPHTLLLPGLQRPTYLVPLTTVDQRALG